MKNLRYILLVVVCFCVCGCIKMHPEVAIKGKVVAAPMIIAGGQSEALSFLINVAENVSPESGLNPLLCFVETSTSTPRKNSTNAAALIECARATETTIELTGKYEGKMFNVKSVSAFGYTINLE